MSTTTDEFEYTEFTEEELSQIDLVTEAAFVDEFATQSLTVETDGLCTSKPESASRRSSGFSVLELTEQELQLLDQSVASLDANNPIHLLNTPESSTITAVRPAAQHIEVVLESSSPSPAPTLGRSSRTSPAPIAMSLFSQFRRSRNALSVSDLVGPAWCELQFDYSLRGGRHLPPSQRPEAFTSRLGKTISIQKEIAVNNDVVKNKGTKVHKQLEREIRPTEIAVTTTTKEDKWGLRLLDMLSNIRILIDEGRCREMPVMGFIRGHYVSGIIDEIVRTNVPPASPTIPGHFFNADGGLKSGASPLHVMRLLDNKTRGVPSIPKWRDSHQSRLQLMLYKRLFDGVLAPSSSASSIFSFPAIWEHQSVDRTELFSAKFLEESAVLVSSNQLGAKAAQATCLKDLEGAWDNMVNELSGGKHIRGNKEAVSKTLTLVYRLREKRSGHKRPPLASSEADSSGDAKLSDDNPKRRRATKKPRADSEDVDLQRAIQASLGPSVRDPNASLQDGGAEATTKAQQDIEADSDVVHAPGGWIPPQDDLELAIQESLKAYRAETGREASPPTPHSPLNLGPSQSSGNQGDRDLSDNIIGTVEFDYDDEILDQHLDQVLDFWHNRRPPNGVALEDTKRCMSCEFADGCEWLEAKAAEIRSRASI